MRDMLVTGNNKERNREISRRVLKGECVSHIARMNGISRNRCIQILRSYCVTNHRDVYMSIAECSYKQPGVNQLRIYAEAFLNNEYDEDTITDASPVRRVKQFPAQLLNALERENIITVGNLLDSDASVLKKAPMIGVISIKMIEDFKRRYRQQDALSQPFIDY